VLSAASPPHTRGAVLWSCRVHLVLIIAHLQRTCARVYRATTFLAMHALPKHPLSGPQN